MHPVSLDLIRWADQLECRSRLPELLRRLVHATGNDLEFVDFSAGEGVQRPGFDGVVRANHATAFIPAGLSVWEVGCDREILRKANTDYRKRSMGPALGFDVGATTYVFVTPRRWAGRDEWAAERRAESRWADVRAYDADNLEQWLDLAPGPAAWLCELLGRPTAVSALEVFWREWAERTEPATAETLLLAGREEVCQATVRWLRDAPSALASAVSDPGEAAAFLYSVVRQMPYAEREMMLQRVIVVTGDEALRQASLAMPGLTIVGLGCRLDIARVAAKRGHHVLVAGAAVQSAAERLDLGPLDRPRLTAELEAMGFAREEAKRLSRESRGDTSALRRLLGDFRNELSPELAPLLLVGAWVEGNPQDESILSEITRRSPHDLAELTRRHSLAPSAPLQRAGSTWRFRSRLDAWRQLAGALAPFELQRFRNAVIAVWTRADPKFDLAQEDRWAASLHGKVHAYSSALRESLLEATVLLAVEHAALSGDVRGQVEADAVVYGVLRGCETWQQWASLDRALPTLAEAAPEVFLHELRDRIEHRPDIFEALMLPHGEGFSRESYEDGLVWALETLAWEPALLANATELLARLAEIVRSSARVRPRAFQALREIFLPWLPHTTASLDDRRAALDSLIRRNPEIGFELLLRLLPEPHDSSTGTHKPYHRSWLRDWNEGVSVYEVHQTHLFVWDKVVELAVAAPKRWVHLLPKLSLLSRDVHRPRAVAALSALNKEDLSTDEAAGLWSALRSELHRHRSYHDARWALPEDVLVQLEGLYRRLTPADPVLRYLWLFASTPELPDFYGHDWHAEQERIAAARAAGAHDILQAGDLSIIIALARQVDDPFSLGMAVSEAGGPSAARRAFEATDEESESWARYFRMGIVRKLFEAGGYAVLGLLGVERWQSRQRAELVLALPFGAATWDLVESWGDEAKAHYWRLVRPGRVEPERDLSRAVRELVAAERPFTALDFAGIYASGSRGKASNLTVDDVILLLRAALRSEPGRESVAGGMVSHHVGEFLEWLSRAGPERRRERLELEWGWFGVLESGSHPGRLLLHEELETNPDFFVELLCLVFRGDGEPTREPSDEETTRARNAYSVLKSWQGLPGARDDVGVDQATLQSWVDRVRALARERGRAQIADLKVGEVLAQSPLGQDGAWPHEAVREVIEHLRNTSDVEDGFVTGRENQRGVFSKALGEGGSQERSLAQTYREHAESLRRRWPTTSRFLTRISQAYEAFAAHEDARGAHTKDTYIWAASDADRLSTWVDSLQARGRYSFTFSEAKEALSERTESDLAQAVEALVERRRLARPSKEFLVVVPLEYREMRAPPASWFLDDWMRAEGRRYHVGLLTGAALHGAAHQQPQTFQVMVDRALEPAVVGRNQFLFVQYEHAGEGVKPLNTPTGSMLVSTPEHTALQLVQFASSVGGIDAVASLLEELGETLDADRLKEAARVYPHEAVRRLGALLDRVVPGQLPSKLYSALGRGKHATIGLRDAEVPAGAKADRWGVFFDRELELDQ